MVTRRQFISGAAGLVAGSALTSFDSFAEPELKPNFDVPAGACDCHIHVIGPQAKYPMAADRVYTPPECGVPQLRAHLKQLNLSRVVLIQPSFYGTDNTFQLLSAKEIGNSARVVIVIDEKTTDKEIANMVKMGARGVRMNLSTGGIFDPDVARKQMLTLANRVKDFKLHIQVYSSAKVIAALSDTIQNLPVPVVLDHFASIKATDFQKQAELPAIMDLVKSGNVYVKLSGIYRISKAEPDYAEVKDLAQLFIQTNSDRMVWASDWPHTNTIPGIPATQVTPYRIVNDVRVLDLLPEWAPNRQDLVKILVSNPARLYDFK
jgi:predicted TIM-barrel fold metal-dependent hydrolase